jgi:hypothetical protein
MAQVIGQNRGKIVNCPNCGAIVEYFLKDVAESWKSDGEGGRELQHYVRCPQEGCQHHITVYPYSPRT